MWRLVPDQRGREPRPSRQRAAGRTLHAARLGAAAGNPSTRNGSGGRPDSTSAVTAALRRAPRRPAALRQCRAHQPVAGIGYQRHAGIRHQRDPLCPGATAPAPQGCAASSLCSCSGCSFTRRRSPTAAAPCGGCPRTGSGGPPAASRARAASDRQGCRSAWKPAQDHPAGRTGPSSSVVRRCGACFVGHLCSFSAH